MIDNRKYTYQIGSVRKRGEYEIFVKWVATGSSVVDLGSGDGTLLKILKDQKNTKGLGVEISPSGVKSAEDKGIKSVVGRIDAKLPFKNKEFDYAICNVTLQMVMYPEVLLKEMVRISKKQIVTFPNFAYILNRLELLFMGQMPKFMIPGYDWYSTGHIHQLSIRDFKIFCRKNNIRILKSSYIFREKLYSLPMFILRKNPNLFASMGIFQTTSR